MICGIVSPRKCHSTGGAVSTEPGLKKTLKADSEFTKNDKMDIMSPTQGDSIVCARLIVLNCCCVPSIQM